MECTTDGEGGAVPSPPVACIPAFNLCHSGLQIPPPTLRPYSPLSKAYGCPDMRLYSSHDYPNISLSSYFPHSWSPVNYSRTTKPRQPITDKIRLDLQPDADKSKSSTRVAKKVYPHNWVMCVLLGYFGRLIREVGWASFLHVVWKLTESLQHHFSLCTRIRSRTDNPSQSTKSRIRIRQGRLGFSFLPPPKKKPIAALQTANLAVRVEPPSGSSNNKHLPFFLPTHLPPL